MPRAADALLHLLQSLRPCPVEADLVSIRIVQIGVLPTPGHQRGRLGELRARGFEALAEFIELLDFEVEADAAGVEGLTGGEQVESDRRRTFRQLEARVDEAVAAAEFF